MRVVYLHQYFNTPSMSGGTRSYEMARRLVAAGHHVHMITSDRESSGKPYETEEAGIRVTWIPVRYSNEMGPLGRARAFAKFAGKSAVLAAKSDADVIFATSTPLTIALPGIYAKWRQRIPMVFEVRDLWPEMPIAIGVLRDPVTSFMARTLERFAYRQSDRVVALSPDMKSGVARAGYPPERVAVIPNSCDNCFFAVHPEEGLKFRQELSWLGDRPLVTYAGTIGEVNGLQYLVDLASEMLTIKSEVRFLLLGTGKEEARVRAYAESLGVLNRNLFMQKSVPKSRMPVVLSASDVCLSLFADIKEMWANSANKFFDALAAGRPVAINYQGWQAKLLLDNRAGIVLNVHQPSESAQQLSDLLHDRTKIRDMGRQARRLAQDRFSSDQLAAQLESVLTESAKRDKPDNQGVYSAP